jgi:hypothetical protein
MSASHSGDLGWRIALGVFLLATIVWLGTTNARAIIGNQLLRPATLTFDDYLAPEAQRELFRLLSITSVVIILSYATALVSGALFLWLMPFSMKEHGWLMVCAILFFIWVPLEGYTLYLDAQMVYEEFFTTVDNRVFRQLFMKRLTALAGAPIIAVLCYYTIVIIAVLQPLRRRAKG